MNTDKAYLFGLIVGGGRLSDRSLTIAFPYRKWGEIDINPDRAGKIAKDILTKVQPIFRNEYKLDVSYHVQPNWRIYTSTISPEFVKDLEDHGLPITGDIRESADIGKMLPGMNEGSKRAFVAGLADSIGSLAPNHRRFVDEYQIVSFEFKGKNFKLVADLVNVLVELGCTPDQVLWNHPNQHSGTDRYYKQWKKGFKVRVTLSDYVSNGSFLFQAKTESAKENMELQKGKDHAGKSQTKRMVVEGPKTVHVDENSSWLPEGIRGYHFIHNQHLSATMGCSTATKEEMESYLKNIGMYVNPFTILTKGNAKEIRDIVDSEPLMKTRTYTEQQPDIEEWLRRYEKDSNALVMGTENDKKGYPVSELLQGIAYVLGSTIGKNVKGKRVLGNFINFLRSESKNGELTAIEMKKPDLLTPVIVTNGSYSALVGPSNPEAYKNLVVKEGEFLYMIRPIEEKDLI